MKKLKLLLLQVGCGMLLFGQGNYLGIEGFSIKSNLPATVEKWPQSNGSIAFSVTQQPPLHPVDAKLVVQIKEGNRVVGGNSTATAMLVTFQAARKTFTVSDVARMLAGTPKLTNGSYTLCIQLFNAKNIPLSKETCKPFKVEESIEAIGNAQAKKGEAGTPVVVPPLHPESGAGNAAIIVVPGDPSKCCDPKFVSINPSPSYSVIFNNDNSFTLSQNLSVTTTPSKLIKSIRAELSYFEFLPGSENCLVCNNNSATYGNFNSGTAALINGTGAGTHALFFSFVPLKPPGSYPLTFQISLPPTVDCCEGIVRFCIRYSIEFEDCTSCSQLACYERKRPGNVLNENLNGNNGKN